MVDSGRVVVVAGGAGILGSAVAAELRAAGDLVVTIDSAPRSGRGDINSIQPVDLNGPHGAREAFGQIQSRFGRIDALVNVVGGFSWEMVTEGRIETWDALYRVNLRPLVIACQCASPLLTRPGGAIVNVGAAAAVRADKGMAAYAASKSGVARLTESLADELKDVGIRVNAVLPSIIDTPANRLQMPDADATRWVKPQQIAQVIAFLISSRAEAVTGALIPVTGRT